jgi:hypothetical protein
MDPTSATAGNSYTANSSARASNAPNTEFEDAIANMPTLKTPVPPQLPLSAQQYLVFQHQEAVDELEKLVAEEALQDMIRLTEGETLPQRTTKPDLTAPTRPS